MADDWKPIICEGVAIIEFFVNEDEEDEEDEEDDNRIQTIEITNQDLDWETDIQDANRPMGAEFSYSATYDFGEGEVTWTVYEYPQGALQHDAIQIDIKGGEVIKDFDNFELAPEDVEIDNF